MYASLKAVLAISLWFLSFIFTQAADTLKIHLTYKHKLNELNQTTGYVTINQKFFTPDDIQFREINYDEKTSQITDYTFYFYKNNLLFTEECYGQNDSLKYILKHDYDINGHEMLVSKLVPKSGQLYTAEKIVNTLDASGKIIRQKKYIGKKAAVLTKLSYDKTGLLIRETKKFKPTAKKEVKNKIKEFSYNSNHSVIEVIITGRNAANKPYQIREEYTYNDKNLLTAVKSYDEQNLPLGEKSWSYLDSGTPSIYQEICKDGKLLLLLQYDYKKHFMDKGTQVSYYENF
jgi:hypothetical protein